MKWLQIESKVLYVVLEKVAESNELANLTQIGRWRHVTKQLKFFPAGLDAIRSENKANIGYLCVSKETFG